MPRCEEEEDEEEFAGSFDSFTPFPMVQLQVRLRAASPVTAAV